MDGGLYCCTGSSDQNYPKEKKEGKWLSEEALQLAEERRKVKGEGERERYPQLNVEFQKIARRYKRPS